MRFELAGTLFLPDPVVLTYIANATFLKQPYLDLGYTRFDVLVIGGGAGSGGWYDTGNTGAALKIYGGGGGGGGLHRVQGILDALPASCPVVVGNGGVKGNDHATNIALVTRGGNGGASTFNTNTAQASGGIGGYMPIVASSTGDPQGWGGEGGLGGRTAAGGGGAQGTTGANANVTTPPTGNDGGDGSYGGGIGEGGGGGAGGEAKYGAPNLLLTASAGGRGSWSSTDYAFYAPAGAIGPDAAVGNANIIPGGGGGAKASPLNNVPTVYGNGSGRGPGSPGVVIIRLYAE